MVSWDLLQVYKEGETDGEPEYKPQERTNVGGRQGWIEGRYNRPHNIKAAAKEWSVLAKVCAYVYH